MIESPGTVEHIDRLTLAASIGKVLKSQGKDFDMLSYRTAIDSALDYWVAHADYREGSNPQYHWDGVVCMEVLEHTRKNSLAREIAEVGVLPDATMNIWITNHGWRLK